MSDVHEGSNNVFADIGLLDADDMLLKSGMVIQLRRLMEAKQISEAAAAEQVGINQADLSKLLRGRFRDYSVERLIKMLVAFDQDVEITMRPHATAGEAARVTFNPITA